LERAKAEAADLRSQIISEAKSISQRLREETNRAVQAEIYKAQKEIRETLVTESLKAAHKALNEQVNDDQHKKLENEFVEKIQVVGS
jgi:F-type H+-transporting ATPase subunit b